jgi:hypothetical protein
MKTHSHYGIQIWENIECLVYCFGCSIGFSCHDFFDEEAIILLCFSGCREYEKNGLVARLFEKIIDLRDIFFVFTEKSSPNRDAYEFLFWWGEGWFLWLV